MHEFDEGCGFAIVTNDTAKEKIEEQLGKATKAKIDPTSRLTNKIQTKLCKPIVSTIGTPPYGISKYLVDIIQPTLNKSQHKVKNSKPFVS